MLIYFYHYSNWIKLCNVQYICMYGKVLSLYRLRKEDQVCSAQRTAEYTYVVWKSLLCHCIDYVNKMFVRHKNQKWIKYKNRNKEIYIIHVKCK